MKISLRWNKWDKKEGPQKKRQEKHIKEHAVFQACDKHGESQQDDFWVTVLWGDFFFFEVNSKTRYFLN